MQWDGGRQAASLPWAFTLTPQPTPLPHTFRSWVCGLSQLYGLVPQCERYNEVGNCILLHNFIVWLFYDLWVYWSYQL